MPPRPKVTREMILDAVLNITRKSGFEAVNARSIAGELQCSTRPIFTCYRNMEELKAEFLGFAFDCYSRFTADYARCSNVPPPLLLPLSYLEFAGKETHLFELLFVSDMDLDMAKADDFYREIGNEKKAEAFSDLIGVLPERGKGIFLSLFFYTHGMAVLTAAGKLRLDSRSAEKMLHSFLAAYLALEREEGREAT